MGVKAHIDPCFTLISVWLTAASCESHFQFTRCITEGVLFRKPGGLVCFLGNYLLPTEIFRSFHDLVQRSRIRSHFQVRQPVYSLFSLHLRQPPTVSHLLTLTKNKHTASPRRNKCRDFLISHSQTCSEC
jgi:hypothetical protein